MKKSLHRILLCLRPNHPGLLIHLKSTFSEKIKDALLPYEQQGIRSLQSEQAGWVRVSLPTPSEQRAWGGFGSLF